MEKSKEDIRQILVKACDGDLSKWYWFLPFALWVDHITTRKGMGCSPFFAVTGAHPVIPLDLVEATWLVELPDWVLTTAELVGYRARTLVKHQQHVQEMRNKIDKAKCAWAVRYKKEHVHTITAGAVGSMHRFWTTKYPILAAPGMPSASFYQYIKPWLIYIYIYIYPG